ncbi:hypothetical protein BDR26DRAFT_934144 [Obelidium mucronatum]|nr:hypothetical protein BDR26DRAFT_934144 [Obelidium mucronatum]
MATSAETTHHQISTKGRIAFYAILQALPLLISAIGVGCLYRVDNSRNTISKASPPLLVNGSGSTRSKRHHVELIYFPVGSGIGRSEFFNGYSLFGSTDSDVSSEQRKYFLPDNANLQDINTTEYTNAKAGQHLGNFMFPVISGALAIVYNVHGINGTLVFNATVLGNIFSGVTTMWNDLSIQELNPSIALPATLINVASRSDSSGSTSLFTEYLCEYSRIFKTLIGASSQPKWPSTFIKRNSAIELMYVCETLDNSITYVPLEAVQEANSASVRVAGIYNKRKRIVFPSVEAVQEALRVSTPGTFSRHQYFSITDADSDTAYPISLMSFVLVREHYFYFMEPRAQTDCDRVQEMVLFWYFAMTQPAATSILTSNGWVPITGILLEMNLKMLSMITCNHVNMMELIENQLRKNEFYGENEEKYVLSISYTFWEIASSSFVASPVGSSIYVLFYSCIFFAGIIPFCNNMINYQISKKKEDEEDQNARLAKKWKARGWKNRKERKYRLAFLSMHQSNVVDSSATVAAVISYCGLIIDSLLYYYVLMVMAVVWVGCLQYAVLVHPFLTKHHPFTAARLTPLHTFIAIYLPNYVAIFYNPSVELFAKALDCRLNPTTNLFMNSFDPLRLVCFKTNHWIMVVLSFVFTTSFVFSVVRYSKILKRLRRNFDLNDKAWKTYFGSVIKCFVVILYFNVPPKLFLIIKAGLEICLAVQENQYARRTIIKEPLILTLFICMVLFVLLGCFYASRQFENELSHAEKERQKKEIAEFFSAFVKDSERDLCDLEGSMKELDQVTPGDGGGVLKPESIQQRNSLASKTYMRKLEPILLKAKSAGIISETDARVLLKSIRNNDPLVSVLFKRCNGDFMIFKELLHIHVIQLFDDKFAPQGIGIASKAAVSRVSLRTTTRPSQYSRAPAPVIVQDVAVKE